MILYRPFRGVKWLTRMCDYQALSNSMLERSIHTDNNVYGNEGYHSIFSYQTAVLLTKPTPTPVRQFWPRRLLSEHIGTTTWSTVYFQQPFAGMDNYILTNHPYGE